MRFRRPVHGVAAAGAVPLVMAMQCSAIQAQLSPAFSRKNASNQPGRRSRTGGGHSLFPNPCSLIPVP